LEFAADVPRETLNKSLISTDVEDRVGGDQGGTEEDETADLGDGERV
jgi:hypothetical protein